MSSSAADPACESCASPPLRRICRYPVVRELAEGSGYLAIAAGGRRVVLKRLEGDCLLRGQLHPNVRQRLERVRELAHMGVANLIGVEREGDEAYLVWEHVEGKTWQEVVGDGGADGNSRSAVRTLQGAADPCHAEGASATEASSLRSQILRCAQDDSPSGAELPPDTPSHAASTADRAITRLARELVLLVEGMHVLGIVHGAIHGRNVILDTNGRLRLIHVSPLLYYDPAEDVAAVMTLLRETDTLLSGQAEERSALAWALDEAEREKASLRRLAELLGQTPRQSLDVAADDEADEEARRLRHGALWGAVAVVALAAGLAYGLWHYAKSASGSRLMPVEAPPAAMQAR